MNEMLGAYDVEYLQLYMRSTQLPLQEVSLRWGLPEHVPEVATPSSEGSSDGVCSEWVVPAQNGVDVVFLSSIECDALDGSIEDGSLFDSSQSRDDAC